MDRRRRRVVERGGGPALDGRGRGEPRERLHGPLGKRQSLPGGGRRGGLLAKVLSHRVPMLFREGLLLGHGGGGDPLLRGPTAERAARRARPEHLVCRRGCSSSSRPQRQRRVRVGYHWADGRRRDGAQRGRRRLGVMARRDELVARRGGSQLWAPQAPDGGDVGGEGFAGGRDSERICPGHWDSGRPRYPGRSGLTRLVHLFFLFFFYFFNFFRHRPGRANKRDG